MASTGDDTDGDYASGLDSYDDVLPFHREDDIGWRMDLSEEEEIIQSSKKLWKMVDTVDETKATVGLALGTSWEQAKDEMEFFRDKMEQKTGSRRPKLREIIHLIFGPPSTVFRAFVAEGIFQDTEHATFIRFLTTFFMSCCYQLSTKQLFDKDSRIKMDGAMTKEEYTTTWNRIGAASTPSMEDRNKNLTPPGLVPFWVKLEVAFNAYSREIFVEGQQSDSSEIATQRCFRGAITPLAAPGTAPGDLLHVRTGQDRGYTNASLLHNYFMKSGAKITAGTVRRQHCIPMTYCQKLLKGDKRIDIPKTGPKTFFTMETTSHGRKLYCFAFRSGTGGIKPKDGVTLGISTEFGAVPEWELVLENPRDLQWYDGATPLSVEEKIRKCFNNLPRDSTDADSKKLSDEFVQRLRGLPVTALNTTQGTPEWFLLRRFSLTSSTTDRAIAVCTGEEDWLEHPDSWKTIKDCLAGIQEPQEEPEVPILQLPPHVQEADEEKEEEKVEQEEAKEEAKEEEPVAVAVEEVTLETLLSDATLAAKINNDEEDEVVMTVVEMQSVLRELGHDLSKAKDLVRKEAADRKTFEAWLTVSHKLKKYWFKKLSDLTRIAEGLEIDTTVALASRNKRDAIRKAINEHLLANPDAVIDVEEVVPRARQKADTSKLSDKLKLQHSVIRAGYLEPLSAVATKYTRRGHQLECHIMRDCLKEHAVDATESPLKLTAACSAPLVMSRSHNFARDSIDFIAMVADGTLIGVEIKARLGKKKDQQETQHVDQIRRLLGQDRTPRQRRVKYFEVDASSAEYATMVGNKHEAVQVLHHAFVYGFDCILLLVGDTCGEVMYGVFITVSAALREAYGHVLSDIYNNTLSWIHDRNEETKPIDEQLKAVLDQIVVNAAAIDNHSFRMDLALWRDVDRNIDKPIPRLARVIPLVFSFWNAIKGGSDATTNLLWHCNYSVPSKENQSIAVARMLSLSAVHVHRLLQLSTAKEDLSFYPSLKRYRDSASERRPFKKSLNMMIGEMTNKRARAVSPQTPPREQGTGRATRSQANIQRLDLPMLATGRTPHRNVAAKIIKFEQEQASGKIDAKSSVVVDRTRNCPGFPIFRVGADGSINGSGSRGRCAHCGCQTHCWCLHCKRWLCDGLSKKAEQQTDFKPHIVVNADSDKPLYGQSSCFFVHHYGNQQKALERFSADAMKKLAP
ncbi:unknown protein [Seminavis robusta]|uniref:Uncharacterized protein n=1 Tax=Seminavis robusta TaxID=568900 RepID=A0A9N8DAH0_9STRA|nr:unknown protein [Seminavis robusta]|eukprot:Sro16_g011570.1 n/a (1191) ;mRNA; r:30132-33878